MSAVDVDFNAPDLAARIEALSQHELDNLPFGVILLDRQGIVLFYSATEARLSGYGMAPLGKNFFSTWECVVHRRSAQRIMSAMESGPVDLEFAWSSDKHRSATRVCASACNRRAGRRLDVRRARLGAGKTRQLRHSSFACGAVTQKRRRARK